MTYDDGYAGEERLHRDGKDPWRGGKFSLDPKESERAWEDYIKGVKRRARRLPNGRMTARPSATIGEAETYRLLATIFTQED